MIDRQRTELEIDFASYMDSLRRDVEIFGRWYEKNHRKSPEEFPLKMLPGDWSEQFLLFNPDEEWEGE